MAKQTYTAGQVLTASQMSSLQANDYNQTVSTKTASYTLVAGDVGTRIVMNAATATTITVNTSLFAAGDTLYIQNIGTGVCTVTSGTCTVTASSPLALSQWSGGMLYFTSPSAAIFSSIGSGAWTAYTPTVTSSSGTITTVGAVSAFYQQIGKTVLVNFSVTITTVGTAAGQMLLTVPVAFSANVSVDQNIGVAKEAAITGSLLQISKSSGGRAAMVTYNAGGVFSSGNGLNATGLFIYEAA
jgi:hypothetical protein